MKKFNLLLILIALCTLITGCDEFCKQACDCGDTETPTVANAINGAELISVLAVREISDLEGKQDTLGERLPILKEFLATTKKQAKQTSLDFKSRDTTGRVMFGFGPSGGIPPLPEPCLCEIPWELNDFVMPSDVELTRINLLREDGTVVQSSTASEYGSNLESFTLDFSQLGLDDVAILGFEGGLFDGQQLPIAYR